MENETKRCKHCQTEIPKKAKVCPNCRKKQGGKLTWIIVAFIVVFVIAATTGGEEEGVVDKVGEMGESQASENNSQGTEKNNVFKVGDIVETDAFRITFLNASVYVSDNQFIQPRDGYEYWEFEFKFENISKSDQVVSSLMDWECYADNSKVDQSYVGSSNNGLDATLSTGRTTQGTVYFEVPKDAEKIELEYDINYWQSDKVIFIGK